MQKERKLTAKEKVEQYTGDSLEELKRLEAELENNIPEEETNVETNVETNTGIVVTRDEILAKIAEEAIAAQDVEFTIVKEVKVPITEQLALPQTTSKEFVMVGNTSGKEVTHTLNSAQMAELINAIRAQVKEEMQAEVSITVPTRTQGGGGKGIGKRAYELLCEPTLAHLTYKELAAKISIEFDSKTTDRCIAWYISHAKDYGLQDKIVHRHRK